MSQSAHRTASSAAINAKQLQPGYYGVSCRTRTFLQVTGDCPSGRFHGMLLVCKPTAAEQLGCRAAHTHSPPPPVPPPGIRLLKPFFLHQGPFFFFFLNPLPSHRLHAAVCPTRIFLPFISIFDLPLFHSAVRYSVKLTAGHGDGSPSAHEILRGHIKLPQIKVDEPGDRRTPCAEKQGKLLEGGKGVDQE